MSIHEECGVFGIYDPNGGCARTAYYGLYALQHRGQEAAGIATINDRELSYHKDLGLVGDVFDDETLERLNGTMAVGHVRYATTGGGRRENAQPLTLKYVKGTLAVAHNGNLVNTPELRTGFEYKGAIFQTTTDSEIIAYAIAQERLRCPSVEEAVCRAMEGLRGAFSLIVMSPRKLVAARDPWGFRPLCMGRRGDAVVFASESCALDAVDAVYEREIEPGEIAVVEDGKVRFIRENCEGATSHMCIFEYIYFARPDSVICGQSVHEARLEAGRILAREHPAEADVVIGVPDSGLDAAMGYAEASGIPYGEGFVKNRYIGRTFITPDQKSRENAVRLKLGALKSQVAGSSDLRRFHRPRHHLQADHQPPAGRGGHGGPFSGLLAHLYLALLFRHRHPGQGEPHRLPPLCGGDPADDRGGQPGLSQHTGAGPPGAAGRLRLLQGMFHGEIPGGDAAGVTRFHHLQQPLANIA